MGEYFGSPLFQEYQYYVKYKQYRPGFEPG